MFQGMGCHILINQFGGQLLRNAHLKNHILGYVEFHEKDASFKATVEVEPSHVNDLVTLIHACKPAAERAFRVKMSIANERRYVPGQIEREIGLEERQIVYDIVGFTCCHDTEFLEIEPSQPDEE